ncbi:GNAT family N-acetyltransferase [Paenibacillus roseipurpureus]|uniref:GNAT family N-acetyltransferase n=1 Tax=Paenibacillus roseopurpureus TaxID=2918901 RepID=A0AA96LIU9_9BACL|nr:GNAT family N-acetyltransferase [Paenibacillus sp. MBLB1832]WNR42602.1 GNAT family N-acetyltransferase [Paenibacillus sp. MBLB1832]
MADAREVHIREAKDSDREAIRRVLEDAYDQYRAVLPPEGWDQYKENIIASVDSAKPIARIIALIDDEVVGSSQLFQSSEAAYGAPELEIESPILRLLAVSPSARGRGIATALIKENIKRAVELGADTLHLHTSDMMESAVKLYERLGFERAYDKDIQKGEILVKSYRLHIQTAAIL